MAGEERDTDTIAFIHVADGLPWANFLQNKLVSDRYNIPSSLHPSSPDQPHYHLDLSALFSSRRLCALMISPEFLEQEYSSFWTQNLDHLLGQFNVLVLLLGVREDDLRMVLGDTVCDRLLTLPWVDVDGSQSTVSNALVKLIEMFESSQRSQGLKGAVQESFSEEEEDEEEEGEEGEEEEEEKKQFAGDEDVYDYPPPPRQQNNIVRVVPSVLYQHLNQEVMILMKRESERPLSMVLETSAGPSRHVEMTHLVSSAYIATVPKDLTGRVSFLVTCGEQTLGGASFYVRSRLEQLHVLLEMETSPVTVLCKAAGVGEVEADRDSQHEELDNILARRLSLSQFPPGLLPLLCSEEPSSSADQDHEEISQSPWPTLLHFAAELNLVRVCEVLLKYPGMIHAACTENRHGLFPCELAERKGFTALHSRLMQYVEDMRHHRGADSGISFPDNFPPPARHGSISPPYINDTSWTQDLSASTSPDEDFMEKGRLYAHSKLRSFSEGCVKTPYARRPSEASIAEEEDSQDNGNNSPPPLKPKLARARSAVNASTLFSGTPPPVHTPPSPPHPNTQEQQSHTQQSHPADPPIRRSASASAVPAEGERESTSDVITEMMSRQAERHTESRSASQASSRSSQLDYELPTKHEATVTVLRSKETKRSKSVQEKISHFFHKIRPARRNRSGSDTNLLAIGKGHKKGAMVRQSITSTSSDPSGYHSYSQRSSVSSSHSERDSGALCDDSCLTQVQFRSKHSTLARHKSKRKGTSMQRRVSVRVQRAKNEDLSERPTLPARGASTSSTDSAVDYKL